MDFKYKDVEAYDDGFIDVCLFNGAIRNSENEHIAKLLREKTKVLVAFGACAAWAASRAWPTWPTPRDQEARLHRRRRRIDNPDGIFPQEHFTVPEGELELPDLYDTVKTLEQTVDVDYFMPGCPPEAHQIAAVLDVVTAALKGEGELPPKGAIVGVVPKTCCDECERVKEEKKINDFKRIWEILPDPEKCLLEQGLICMGPATRAGCGARCTGVDMPCRGCYGAPDGVDRPGRQDAQRRRVHRRRADPRGDRRDRRRPSPIRWARSTASACPVRCSGGRKLMKKITIDPITRLEGHGKIEIFLDDDGEVANAYFQIPELRGFEKFCEGRPVEEMPRITPRICGVCPAAHHMAAAKAVDAVFDVELAPAGRKLRELLYSAFYVDDHTTHFYVLGGPDFVVGPERAPAERNILGVIDKVGLEIGGAVIKLRARPPRSSA